jgi:hypothetical protein
MHAVYSIRFIRVIRRQQAASIGRRVSRHPYSLLIRSVVTLLLLHFTEAALWAAYYVLGKGLPDFATAIYFSMVSYATTGYGDVVLPMSMRLVGAAEGMVGTLMAGWSVALIVAVVQRMLVIAVGVPDGKHGSIADAMEEAEVTKP